MLQTQTKKEFEVNATIQIPVSIRVNAEDLNQAIMEANNKLDNLAIQNIILIY